MKNIKTNLNTWSLEILNVLEWPISHYNDKNYSQIDSYINLDQIPVGLLEELENWSLKCLWGKREL